MPLGKFEKVRLPPVVLLISLQKRSYLKLLPHTRDDPQILFPIRIHLGCAVFRNQCLSLGVYNLSGTATYFASCLPDPARVCLYDASAV